MKLTYEQKLLQNWEDVYRQGLLTFWIFIALYDEELDVVKLKQRIHYLTQGTYSTSEQALYRVLRKHYDLELVNVRKIPTASGPNRKLYSLSKLGKQLLELFVQRNIRLLTQPIVQRFMKKEKSNENN